MITGKTKLFAVIGSPIEHSGSPQLYNRAFEEYGLDYRYMAFDVNEDKLEDVIAGIKALGIKGINVTMPCKRSAAKMVDILSEEAELAEAVNTIVNKDGKLYGYNTDGIGYIKSLENNGISVENKKITILGGGGAGTAIAIACALNGMSEICIFTRKGKNLEKLKKVQEYLKNIKNKTILIFDFYDENALAREVKSSDIFANATNIGMKPLESQMPINDMNLFREGLIVTDAVYNPETTRFLAEAKKAGCKIIDGKEMLYYQGEEAFNLFTGKQLRGRNGIHEKQVENLATLEEARRVIDDCDTLLLSTLAARMKISSEVAKIKKKNNMEIFQPEREAQQILSFDKKLKNEFNKEEIKAVMKNIIAKSKEIQYRALLPEKIYIVGYMGAGKSTVAKKISQITSIDYIDLDEVIIENEQKSINEIFDKYGEKGFREKESIALKNIANSKIPIISCGGGTILSQENISIIKSTGKVVYIDTPLETIKERLKGDFKRPLIKSQNLESLYKNRLEKYEKAADVIVNTNGKSIDEIAYEILQKLINA